MNDSIVIDCSDDNYHFIKSLQLSVNADGNVVMAVPSIITEATGAAACIVEPRVLSTFWNMIASRNEDNRYNGWASLGDAVGAPVRVGYYCSGDGLYVYIYWLENGEATGGCSKFLSWDELEPLLAFEANTRARRQQRAPAQDQPGKNFIGPDSTIAVRCWDLHRPDTKEVAFSVKADGVVAMTVPPILTKKTGATFCTIKPTTFEAMCLLIESRGEQRQEGRWIILGGCQGTSVRAGYICKDDGLEISTNWVDEDGEVFTNKPETIPWDDLQPLLQLRQALTEAQQWPVPAFGLSHGAA